MLVRDATPVDADAIARVRVSSWQVAYAHAFPPEALATMDEAAIAEFWREHIDTGSAVLVTDDLTGFASIGPARGVPDAGEVYAIYVTPEQWGTGRGRALMEAALERLRAEGYSSAILWVLDDNPRARRFYEAAGWETDGGEQEDEFFGIPVNEVRYRISLR